MIFFCFGSLVPIFWCESSLFPPIFWDLSNHSKSKVAAKVDLASPSRISNVLAEPWSRWWFVSKSGKLTSWGNGSWNPIIYRFFDYTSQVVGWDFWTINSIKRNMMINDDWLQKLYKQCMQFLLWLTTNWLQQFDIMIIVHDWPSQHSWCREWRYGEALSLPLISLLIFRPNAAINGSQDAVVNTAMQSACGRSYVQSPELDWDCHQNTIVFLLVFDETFFSDVKGVICKEYTRRMRCCLKM